jgi:Holliday junction resolvase RusA-like endonuclease
MNIIDYKGLTVNQAYTGKRYKTKKYKAWKKDIKWLLPKDLWIPPGEKHIRIVFGLSSKNADWDNCIKTFQDVLQEVYGFNDKEISHGEVVKLHVKKGKEFIAFDLLPANTEMLHNLFAKYLRD